MAVGGLLLGIIAIFIPPLAVLWRAGCGFQFLINIVLLFLGWIPAVLHAWFVILDSPNIRQRHREHKAVETEYVVDGGGRRSYESGRQSYKSHGHGHGDHPRRSRSRSVNSRPSTVTRSHEPLHRPVYDSPTPPRSGGYGYASAPDPYYGQQSGYAPAPRY